MGGYRSTSLGQFEMARAALVVWWQTQSRLIDLARGIRRSESGTMVQKGWHRAVEVHRYLAEPSDVGYAAMDGAYPTSDALRFGSAPIQTHVAYVLMSVSRAIPHAT